VAPAVRVDKRHGDEMGGARGMLRREEGRKRVAASMGRPLFYGHGGGGGRAGGERHAVARGSGRGSGRCQAAHVGIVWTGEAGPMTRGPGAYSNGQRQNLIQISNGFELYSNSFKI
jgi:hypothetical protein